MHEATAVRRTLLVAALGVFTLGILGACDRKEAPVQPATQPTSSAAADTKPINVGVILPLTGDAAQYGTSLKSGADLAAQEINARGGSDGQPLQLLYEDSRAEPVTAVSAINKLISADRVKVVIGDMFSSTTLAIAPIAQRARVVLVSPTASAEAVPRVGEYVFSIYPSDAYDGHFLAQEVRARWPAMERAAIVYAQAEAMITAKNAFKSALSDGKLRVVTEEAVPAELKDLSSIVTTLKAAEPQLVLVAAYLPETTTFLRQAAQQGLKAKFLAISTCYDPKIFELAGESADGLIFSAPFFETASPSPQVKAFVTAYRQRHNSDPDVWAAYGYDVVRIVSRALTGARGDADAVRGSLMKIRDFQGATGSTTIGPDRAVSKQLRLLVVDSRSRTFRPIDRD